MRQEANQDSTNFEANTTLLGSDQTYEAPQTENYTEFKTSHTLFDSKTNTIELESPCLNHHLVLTECTMQNHVFEVFLLIE